MFWINLHTHTHTIPSAWLHQSISKSRLPHMAYSAMCKRRHNGEKAIFVIEYAMLNLQYSTVFHRGNVTIRHFCCKTIDRRWSRWFWTSKHAAAPRHTQKTDRNHDYVSTLVSQVQLPLVWNAISIIHLICSSICELMCWCSSSSQKCRVFHSLHFRSKCGARGKRNTYGTFTTSAFGVRTWNLHLIHSLIRKYFCWVGWNFRGKPSKRILCCFYLVTHTSRHCIAWVHLLMFPQIF